MIQEWEHISLQQANRILTRYPKVFIAPESLRFDYGPEYQSWGVERFPDTYFKSTETYSELCLSKSFYARFKIYEYMLIYQTDAFVFSDQLEKFCALGFDYIGAPVPKSVWRFLPAHVGNGGLSLRKINSVLRVLDQKKAVLRWAAQTYSSGFLALRLQIEDQFFAYCSTLIDLHFSVPSIQVAARFSVESDFGGTYQRSLKDVPFGCHRWYQNNFFVWWPIIQNYGYRMDKKTIWDAVSIRDEFRVRHIKAYLLERFMQQQRKNTHYSIWGYGADGHKCANLLEACSVPIDAIYDTSANSLQNELAVPLKKPMDQELKARQSIIIIATAKYEADISRHLEGLGLQKNVDFVSFYPAKTYKALGCKL